MSAKQKIPNRPKSVQFQGHVAAPRTRTRATSVEAIEELVQCGICLDKMTDPRMLACQHTFCLSCLQTHLTIKSNSTRNSFIHCPLCQNEVVLERGLASLVDLPKNFYVDSLLSLITSETGGSRPTSTRDEDIKLICVVCAENNGNQSTCLHCKQVHCSSCLNTHLVQLSAHLVGLKDQLNEIEMKLLHKNDNFSCRLHQLSDSIASFFEEKIVELKRRQEELTSDLTQLQWDRDERCRTIHRRVLSLKEGISGDNALENTGKIIHFQQIVKEVQLFGEARLVFDSNTLKLDQIDEGIYEDVAEVDGPLDSNELHGVGDAMQHFKTRSFKPKLLWNKCPRPAGVGTAPWDPVKLYITTTDFRSVLIFDRNRMKLVDRITHPQLAYPCSVAFSSSRREIYVSDKWSHCVHVFRDDGSYERSLLDKRVISPEGIAVTDGDELVVCDTGNDRVLVVDLQTREILMVLGSLNGSNKSEMCMPTGVAVDKDRIVVADAGNNRIKVYSKNEGRKLFEFGSLGKERGQFRSAEVVTIAPHGFILVGDAGNARIQVFQSDGQLVKILGGKKESFRWISGLFVTPNLDIIATDNKSRSLRIF